MRPCHGPDSRHSLPGLSRAIINTALPSWQSQALPAVLPSALTIPPGPRALWWWQHVAGMPVPSLLETASLVPPEKHISSAGMATAAEVQRGTGWGGLAGVWWCHPAEFEVLKGMLGIWQGRGGGGMLPTAWPRALPQESACLQPWATEPGENNRDGHKAEPQGTWALKRTQLNLTTHHFTWA